MGAGFLMTLTHGKVDEDQEGRATPDPLFWWDECCVDTDLAILGKQGQQLSCFLQCWLQFGFRSSQDSAKDAAFFPGMSLALSCPQVAQNWPRNGGKEQLGQVVVV